MNTATAILLLAALVVLVFFTIVFGVPGSTLYRFTRSLAPTPEPQRPRPTPDTPPPYPIEPRCTCGLDHVLEAEQRKAEKYEHALEAVATLDQDHTAQRIARQALGRSPR